MMEQCAAGLPIVFTPLIKHTAENEKQFVPPSFVPAFHVSTTR